MSDFWEKYKHPKWQEKRLRIMDRAKFRCERCRTDESTLNVHHAYYQKGKEPWEYPDTTLHCLCESCHKQMHEELREVQSLYALLPPELARQVRTYMMAVRAIATYDGDDSTIRCEGDDDAAGIADAFHVHADDVAVMVNEDAISVGWLWGEKAKSDIVPSQIDQWLQSRESC